MSLNCNEIDVILGELDLSGSFIQDIVQPGYDTLALYTYKNGTPKTVLICTKPDSCRINETRHKIPRNEKPLRFMEFLKSRIKGAKILSCAQIEKERIIKMELGHDSRISVMYIRLWSNAGNIILCDDNGIILDAMYRRPAKGESAGSMFTLPERDPLRQQKEWPVRTFSEIDTRYQEKNPGSEPLTFNEKVDIWYSEYSSSLSRESLLEQAAKWYNARHSRQQNALERLEAKRESFKNAGLLKHQGDLILAFGYQLDGKTKFLECTDYETGKPVCIQIDPAKSVQENAAVYYDNYKKETSGITELDHEIELARKNLELLEQTYQTLQNEQNPVRIEQLLRHDSKPKQQEKKKHPGLDYTIDGWYILVGRDADENDDLLRHYVKGPDLWMHARDFSGGFIFIKNRPGKTIPLDILLYAGNLAVYYSKARKSGKADLYYTHVKYLRRAKDGPKGLVLPTHEKNLTVKLDETILRKLDEIHARSEYL